MKDTRPLAQEVDGILDRFRATLAPQMPGSVVKPATLAIVNKMATAFESLHELAQQAAAKTVDLRASGDLTAAAKIQRMATINREIRGSIDSDLAALDAGLNELKTTLGKVATPPRPAGDPAAQEGRLANLRSDAAMVLDRTEMLDLPKACADLISTWSENGDPLAVWFLASSGWLPLYLQARNANEARPLIEAAIAGAVAPSNSDDAALARTILAMLTGPNGLSGALVRMRFLLNQQLDQASIR